MAVWRLFFKSEASHGYYYLQRAVTPNPASSNFLKSVPNDHNYLQKAVTLDWIGSIALWECIRAFKGGATLWRYKELFFFNE
jgi:hypothetical protein